MHVCPLVNPGPLPHVGGLILPAGCPTVLIGMMPAEGRGCSTWLIPRSGIFGLTSPRADDAGARFQQNGPSTPMNLLPLIAETQRRFRLLQQTQEAMRRERAQRIHNADLVASDFMRDHVLPLLCAAGQALAASGKPAVYTSRLDDSCARGLLTVAIDGGAGLSLLAFEARLGSETPAVSWTFGGPVHTLSSLSSARVSAIVAQFTGNHSG
jgi:hypothetical protein